MNSSLRDRLISRTGQLLEETKQVYREGNFDLARHIMSSAHLVFAYWYVMRSDVTLDEIHEITEEFYHGPLRKAGISSELEMSDYAGEEDKEGDEWKG